MINCFSVIAHWQNVVFFFSVGAIRKWYNSMRTVYNRLSTDRKEGLLEHKRLTARESWTLKSFAFLEEHIVHKRSKRKSEVSKSSPYTTSKLK